MGQPVQAIQDNNYPLLRSGGDGQQQRGEEEADQPPVPVWYRRVGTIIDYDAERDMHLVMFASSSRATSASSAATLSSAALLQSLLPAALHSGSEAAAATRGREDDAEAVRRARERAVQSVMPWTRGRVWYDLKATRHSTFQVKASVLDHIPSAAVHTAPSEKQGNQREEEEEEEQQLLLQEEEEQPEEQGERKTFAENVEEGQRRQKEAASTPKAPPPLSISAGQQKPHQHQHAPVQNRPLSAERLRRSQAAAGSEQQKGGGMPPRGPAGVSGHAPLPLPPLPAVTPLGFKQQRGSQPVSEYEDQQQYIEEQDAFRTAGAPAGRLLQLQEEQMKQQQWQQDLTDPRRVRGDLDQPRDTRQRAPVVDLHGAENPSDQHAFLSRRFSAIAGGWHGLSGEGVIGRRVEVIWMDASGDSVAHCGVIEAFDPRTLQHSVHYDDGDREWHNLKKTRYNVIDLDDPSVATVSTPTTRPADQGVYQTSLPRPVSASSSQELAYISSGGGNGARARARGTAGAAETFSSSESANVQVITEVPGSVTGLRRYRNQQAEAIAAAAAARAAAAAEAARNAVGGAELVGRRVRVTWEDRSVVGGTISHSGSIKEYNWRRKEHLVLYDDGDMALHHLPSISYELVA